MPVLLAAAGDPCGLSSGGSGVIFTSRSPPGSHRPRVAPGCVRRYSSPSMPFAAAQCTGRDGRRPTGFRASARGRGVARRGADGGRGRAADPNGRDGPAGLPGGELGTTDAGCRCPAAEAGATGGVPRCRGAGVDLSSQHDSRARSQYVKGPRPWWRRRPPTEQRQPAARMAAGEGDGRGGAAAGRRPHEKAAEEGRGREGRGRGRRRPGRRRPDDPRRRRRRPRRRLPGRRPAKKTAAEKSAVDKARRRARPGRRPRRRPRPRRPGPRPPRTDGSPHGGSEEERRPARRRPRPRPAALPKAAGTAATAPGELAVRPGEDPWTPEEVAEARTRAAGEVLRLRHELEASEAAAAGLMRDSGDGAGDDEADTGHQEHHPGARAGARRQRPRDARTDRARPGAARRGHVRPLRELRQARSARRGCRPSRGPRCAWSDKQKQERRH